MFTRESVEVWLRDVEVFHVGVEQVNGWIESGRLDRFYPRQAGKYVVVMAGSCFGRDDWEYLHEMSGVRVGVSHAFDSLSEAMDEIRYFVAYDLENDIPHDFGTFYRYDYEIWHLCDDSVLYAESLLAGRPRFSDMNAVVEYVESSLGALVPEFDCWAIAQDITVYVNGWYYDVKDHDDYWRIVASHVLA